MTFKNMRHTSEKVIEKHLSLKVKNAGGLCIKLLCDQFTGLPDRMCLFPNGRIVFVELKSSGKKPTRIQTIVQGKIRDLGFRVEVIDNIDGVNNLISEYA